MAMVKIQARPDNKDYSITRVDRFYPIKLFEIPFETNLGFLRKRIDDELQLVYEDHQRRWAWGIYAWIEGLEAFFTLYDYWYPVTTSASVQRLRMFEAALSRGARYRMKVSWSWPMASPMQKVFEPEVLVLELTRTLRRFFELLDDCPGLESMRRQQREQGLEEQVHRGRILLPPPLHTPVTLALTHAGKRLEPRHIVLTERVGEIVLAVLAQLPSAAGVRMKRKIPLNQFLNEQMLITTTRNTFLHPLGPTRPSMSGSAPSTRNWSAPAAVGH